MAKAGDELVNPVTGLRSVFQKTAQESSGELLQVSESYFLEPILGGEVVHPAGDVTEPFVDADDIADVAVAALTEEGHAGEIYELTGPRLLTFAEAVGDISKATGRKVRYAPVSMPEFESLL